MSLNGLDYGMNPLKELQHPSASAEETGTPRPSLTQRVQQPEQSDQEIPTLSEHPVHLLSEQRPYPSLHQEDNPDQLLSSQVPLAAPAQALSSDREARRYGIFGPSPEGSPGRSSISIMSSESKNSTVQAARVLLSGKAKAGRETPWIFTALWSGIRKAGQAINSQFSPSAIWELINPIEYVYPITMKKVIVLIVVMGLVATIVISNHFTQWITSAMNQTRAYMLPVLIIVFGLEPSMFFIILVVARVPKLNEPLRHNGGHDVKHVHPSPETQGIVVREGETVERFISQHEDVGVVVDLEAQSIPRHPDSAVALVIPCHNSNLEALGKVLDSAYPYFRPRDVFVVDNGRSRYPKDLSFRDWVRDQHSELNYIWSPIGSKSAAQLVGAMAAKGYNFILTVDDDVSLPANYRHPIHLINDKVKAVSFPLHGINAFGNCPLFLVAWQDAEFRMAGLTKLAEARLCGVCFPHGAGWFVDRDTLIEMHSKHHPTDFIAEDVNSGFAFMAMGKRIACDGNIILSTEVPTSLLGPGLNWFKQRMKSWEMGRHAVLPKFTYHFFSLNGQRAIQGIIAQKFILAYSIGTVAVDWVRVPVLVTMAGDDNFWRTAGLISLAAAIPIMLYNYIKCWHRPDLRVRPVAGLTYPIYKILYSFVSVLGAIRCVLFYIGGHQKAKPVRNMVKDGDTDCFWLDPRFNENPAWLVEEKEESMRNGEDAQP